MDLRLATHEADGMTVVEVGGEIDVYTAPQLRTALNDAIADGARDLVVDMGGTDFLDSTGLGVLVGCLKRVRSLDGELRLVCDSEKILKVFRITGLTKVFDIRSSLSELSAAPADGRL